MSRFVTTGTSDEAPSARDEAWLKAQAELEAKHVAQQVAARSGGGEEKSLYETLQANKAAKQDAFEESMRLKNQFRSLDEDEVEFLENLTAGERAEAKRVREETREQVEAFRVQREEAERAAAVGPGEGEGVGDVLREEWVKIGGKKRKKGKEREGIGGVKVRRTSTVEEVKGGVVAGEATQAAEPDALAVPDLPASTTAVGKDTIASSERRPTPSSASTAPAAALGLGGYDSDEDE